MIAKYNRIVTFKKPVPTNVGHGQYEDVMTEVCKIWCSIQDIEAREKTIYGEWVSRANINIYSRETHDEVNSKCRAYYTSSNGDEHEIFLVAVFNTDKRDRILDIYGYEDTGSSAWT